MAGRRGGRRAPIARERRARTTAGGERKVDTPDVSRQPHGAEVTIDEGPIRRLRAAARDAKRLRDRIEEAQEVDRQRSRRAPAWGSRKRTKDR
jgi:hypothetical protein